MIRWLILGPLGLFIVACSATPAPKPAVAPVAAAATPRPTAAPTAQPTPAGPDYVKLRQELLLPLGALIVATRDKSPRVALHLASFNEVAARVEPIIAQDMSVNANRLSSGIKNTRTAAAQKDLAELERVRLNLLEVH